MGAVQSNSFLVHRRGPVSLLETLTPPYRDGRLKMLCIVPRHLQTAMTENPPHVKEEQHTRIGFQPPND
jgi:hypothetical protein